MSDSDSFAINFDDDDRRGFGFLRRHEPLIQPPRIDVYLAGPLTNTDESTNLECQCVRQIVKNLFHKYDFLGVTFEVYDPADVTPPGTDHSPEDVYTTDHRSTANADLVVFHVNTPSLGVGMEAQISASATIPRVIISKQGSLVSRMFRGVFNPTLARIDYHNPWDVKTQLEQQIATIAARTIESAEKRRPIENDLVESRLGKRILKQRILKQVTVQELAAATDIREFWILELERDDRCSARSFMECARICNALDCRATLATDGDLKFSSEREEELSADQRMSLENLASFVRSREHRTSEQKVFRLWKAFVEQQSEALEEAGKFRSGQEDTVISEEEWRQRYDSMKLF